MDDAEVCDDGLNDGSYGGCLPGCVGLAPHCGDAETQSEEACDDGNAVDSDGCNVDCVTSGSVRWTETFSLDAPDRVSARTVAVGPGDDVYVAGGRDAQNGREAWLQRLDLDGNQIWELVYLDDQADDTVANGMDVDEAGNAYVGGLADYGGNNGSTGWVRVYDPAATLVYAHDAGPEVFDVGVSDDGNAALVGSSIALLGIEGQPRGPLQTRRLGLAGDTLWTRELDPVPAEEPYAERIAVDSNEDIVVVANFKGDGAPQAWIRKFTANGSESWTDEMLQTEHQSRSFRGVACGPNDEVVVVGAIDGEMWARKYDQDGVEEWTISETLAGGEFVNAAIDDDGSIVLIADEGTTASVRKLTSIGAELWTTTIDEFVPTDVAIDSQHNILVSGTGDGDGWIRKLAP